MIIKRYDGSAFQELFPKTISQRLFANNGTTPLFDGNGKINEQFLPDSVFDSLYFFGTVSANSDIRNLGIEAADDADGSSRSPKGYYWVATAPCTISSGTGAITVGPYTATTSGINPSEEGVSSGTSVALETGDWFILIDIQGSGTTQSPWSFNFATVNNTYETAKAAVHGIVKLFSNTQQSTAAQGVSNTASRTYGIQNNAAGQLVVNVPWQNTVFTHPTFDAINANAVNNGVNVVDNISVNTDGHVTAVGLRNLSNATTSAAGVMSAADKDKLDGIASGAQANVATNLSYTNSTRVIASSTGNNATLPLVTTSIDGLMSNDDKTKLDGIAAGAQANVATNLGYTTAASTGTVTSSTGNNATLPAATPSLAGLLTGADKTKLNGIAAGATTNTGTVTSITVAAGSGMSGGGTVTTSGTVTLTNTAQNADHTGDVTGSAALTIGNNKVTNAKLADMPGFRIKGKNTTGTADPMDLTTAQVRTLTNTVALFFQTTAPTVHADGVALQAGTLWFDTSA